MNCVSFVKLILAISIAVLSLSSIEAAPGESSLNSRPMSKDSVPKRSSCACPRIYWPVCGSDNVTYGKKTQYFINQTKLVEKTWR